MSSRWCRFCKSDIDVQEHHIIPKSIGGTDADGRILLCKKCHHILHLKFPSILIGYIDVDRMNYLREHIKNWTLKQVRYPHIRQS